MKSLLITGCTGYVGRQVARQLKAKGFKVTGTARRKCISPAFPVLDGDHASQRFWEEALINQDVVIHFAALTRSGNAQDFYVNNEQVTSCLVQVAKRHPTLRFIHISSDHAVASSGLYAISKRNCEKIVRDHISTAIILRLSAVLGEFDSTSKSTFCKIVLALKNRPFLLIPGGRIPINPVCVADIADVIATAISRNLHGGVYGLTGETCTLKEVIAHFEERLRVHRPKISVPLWIVHAIATILKKIPIFSFLPLDAALLLGKPLQVNFDGLGNAIGFKPRTIESIIANIEHLPS